LAKASFVLEERGIQAINENDKEDCPHAVHNPSEEMMTKT
jgi:hypothetical protein